MAIPMLTSPDVILTLAIDHVITNPAILGWRSQPKQRRQESVSERGSVRVTGVSVIQWLQGQDKMFVGNFQDVCQMSIDR